MCLSERLTGVVVKLHGGERAVGGGAVRVPVENGDIHAREEAAPAVWDVGHRQLDDGEDDWQGLDMVRHRGDDRQTDRPSRGQADHRQQPQHLTAAASSATVNFIYADHLQTEACMYDINTWTYI